MLPWFFYMHAKVYLQQINEHVVRLPGECLGIEGQQVARATVRAVLQMTRHAVIILIKRFSEHLLAKFVRWGNSGVNLRFASSPRSLGPLIATDRRPLSLSLRPNAIKFSQALIPLLIAYKGHATGREGNAMFRTVANASVITLHTLHIMGRKCSE